MIELSPQEPPPSPELLAAIRDELHSLYRELDLAVAETGPVCVVSGRCCRFKEYGHTLFLSAPEAALAGRRRPAARRPNSMTANAAPGKTPTGGARPVLRGPWGAASTSAIRPSSPERPELSEVFLNRLKRLAERHGWPWNYAPLHHHLRSLFFLDINPSRKYI